MQYYNTGIEYTVTCVGVKCKMYISSVVCRIGKNNKLKVENVGQYCAVINYS